MRYILLSLIILTTTLEEPMQAYSQLKSRHKRYVVFPEGSTFSVAFCNTWKTLTGDRDIYTLGMNWAVSYDLPNVTLKDPETKRPYLRRRHRREVYRRLEVALESAGFDGHSCILRTLCEAAKYMKSRNGLFQELLRLIFTMPEESQEITPGAEELEVYLQAQLAGTSQKSCMEVYRSCPFSVLAVMLGDVEY